MQIAVQHDMMLHQMDVKSAYLHAPIRKSMLPNRQDMRLPIKSGN